MRLFVDPAIFEILRGKFIDVQVLLEGYLKGKHRSPFIGHSLEYKDTRSYTPGDDLKFILWRVYARTEKFYVKRFEEETNIKVLICLDVSRSMGVEGKGDVGKKLAIVFAYLAYLSKDAFGLFLFNDSEVNYLAPSTTLRSFVKLFEALEGVEFSGKTSLTEASFALSSKLKKRALILLISDFFFSPSDFEKFLRYFKGRGHEVLVVPVISKEELVIPVGDIILEDSESGLKLPAYGDTVSELKSRIEAHFQRIMEVCNRYGVRYFSFFVEDDFNTQLRKFFEV